MMLRKSRRVWRYVLFRQIHNALPYFAVIAATGSPFSWPSILIALTMLTGFIVDISFWDALEGEVR